MTNLAVLALAAHPGHGTTVSGTWMHYLTEPVHVLLLAGAAWGAVGFVRVLGALLRDRGTARR
jgi:putative copper export protein